MGRERGGGLLNIQLHILFIQLFVLFLTVSIHYCVVSLIHNKKKRESHRDRELQTGHVVYFPPETV